MQTENERREPAGIPKHDFGGRLAITIPEAAHYIGISRNAGYQAAAAGQIPVIKIGRRRLVPVAALLRLLGE